MCGLAGLLRLDGEALGPERAEVVRAMAGRLVHRGPDAAGEWLGREVALGFRRLRVIDLEHGEQPIANENGDVRVVLNGEIYNFLELRQDLVALGHVFKTQSDTEVLVHGYESWGVEGLLARLRGMFVLALWDAAAKRLLLARDRLGKKPVFWSVDPAGRELAFASELKGLQPWPGLDRRLDRQALDDYWTFLYIPHRRSIFAAVHELAPASYLEVVPGGQVGPSRRYWSPDLRPQVRPRAELVAELRERLETAVRLRLRSDVPVGAFLSGGLDSALVAGLAERQLAAAGGKLDTFTLGFRDPRFDERPAARASAAFLGTRHHDAELDVAAFRPEELVALVEKMDEPFGDSSFLPTFWLARLARQQVTVALSGDGGDELFAGYRRYAIFERLERLARWPHSVLALLGTVAKLGRPLGGERQRQAVKAFDLARRPQAERLRALLTYFSDEEKAALYRPETRIPDGSAAWIAEQLAALPGDLPPLARFLARDLLGGGLVDDGLQKVDRASMACSLEVRNPLLDQEVVELALTIPIADKRRQGDSKAILKEAFPELLPPAISQRPKQGFEVPFAAFFARPEWRDLLVDTLSPARLARQSLLAPEPILFWRDLLLRDPEAKSAPCSAYQLRHRVYALLVFFLWCDAFAPDLG